MSVFVLRRIDYTLEAMAVLSLVPAFQGIVLWGLAREEKIGPGNRIQDLGAMASRHWVRVAWAFAALALTAWIFKWFPDGNPRALVSVISGIGLTAAGVAATISVRRRSDQGNTIRLAPIAVICGALGLSYIAAGLGFWRTIVPPLGIVTASVWALGAVFLVPALLWAAPALRRGPALLLETSAVISTASMSSIPMLLYFRPYSGAAWLDPARLALLSGTALILTAMICSDQAPMHGTPSSPAKKSSNVRGWIALWLTLQGSYLIGCLGLGIALGGRPDFSLGSFSIVVLIPAVQFLTISLYRSLRTVRRECPVAEVCDPRSDATIEERGQF